MNKSDFFYDLPQELIAQTPSPKRDGSRLMVFNRMDGHLEHKHFFDLPEFLKAGDCIVINDSKVLPARLLGQREDTGSPVEVLLLRDEGEMIWECITKPGKRTREGNRLVFGNGELAAEVVGVDDTGNRHIRFECDGIFMEILDRLGHMPLPPYITEQLEQPERYQTVYASHLGSAAAPTAGLHFTPELLVRLQDMGVKIAKITLHVGLGTFRPVKADRVEDHHMHSEYYEIPSEAAEMINRTRAEGGRVIAVGTTSTRTLESAANEDGTIPVKGGWTDIFIYPGYQFKCVDGLITNFHLPESTLIMLVSAFAGYEHTMNAYKTAVAERYRFFSFGDAMLII